MKNTAFKGMAAVCMVFYMFFSESIRYMAGTDVIEVKAAEVMEESEESNSELENETAEQTETFLEQESEVVTQDETNPYMEDETTGQLEVSSSATENDQIEELQEKIYIGIDNVHIYEGMAQSFSDGYQPRIRDGKLFLVIPFCANGSLQGNKITVDLEFSQTENSPFILNNYQKDVQKKWFSLNEGKMREVIDVPTISGNDVDVTVEMQEIYLYTCEIPMKENAFSGQYFVTVKASGYTEQMQKVTLDYKVSIQFTEGKEPVIKAVDESLPKPEPEEVIHKPKMILVSCDLNGREIGVGTQESMDVSFQNCSAERYMYNLKISVLSEPSIVHFSKYSFYYEEIAPGESAGLHADFKTLQDAEGGSVFVYFNLEYEDEKGNMISDKEMAVFCILPNEDVIRKPKMLLESCTLSGKELLAGTSERMEVVFKNYSELQTMYNLKLTVSTESTSMQFSQTSFYATDVAPLGTFCIGGELKIVAEADRGTAPLYFDFEYEDENGNAVTGKEAVMLMIEQPVEMELEAENIPDVLYSSDTTEFSIKALNLSRTSVYNVRIRLSAKGLFPVSDVFIGNLEAGTEGAGMMRVYVGTRTMESVGNDVSKNDEDKYGQIKGIITMQYEDADGEIYTLDKEFQTDIKKPQVLSLEVNEQEEKNSWWISVFTVMIIGLVVLCVLLLVRLRKKIYFWKRQRKFLMNKRYSNGWEWSE